MPVRCCSQGGGGLFPARSTLGLVVGLLLGTAPPCPAQSQPWEDPGLLPERRAELLVAAMTRDEKIALVHGAEGPYCGDIPPIPRLGVPKLDFSDGPAGVTCWSDPITEVTAFPAPISVAASWDPALARELARAMGIEARGKGIDVSLAPMLTLVRDGRYGRAFEVYGEDPWLAAALAGPIVNGIQGAGAIATPKGFVNNDQETDRGASSSEVEDRVQREIFHPPFRAAARAGAGAWMTAYNRVNGRWTSEAEEFLL